ncbi:cytochrome c5 [Caulobacter sp. AP07]|uniref:c-type cytochrome n=1 Tax=Caulobacter sp. AP07 TaxID=1144304 RepID=UPI000271DA3A|nr:c-type cytochrome [Caulobacter sp. AP07]EJL28715.1 cytochrome c5 [Caulobacter sp. AP07]
MRVLVALVLVAGLAACSKPVPPAPTPEQALALAPADPHLATLYGESCKACHAIPGTGAPLVHDRKAWDPRWKQGEAVLLDHSIQGFQAMPAGGQCVACNPDDFKALIRFMAGREDPAT